MIIKNNFHFKEDFLLKIFLIFGLIIILINLVIAIPSGPNGVTVRSNSTFAAVSTGYQINVSGGYMGYINISSTVVNPKWKALVGNVTGKFTLSDATSNVIYDWALGSLTGRIYATRNSSTVSWTNISCANISAIERENVFMNHTNSYDNITRTFNNSIHSAFFVGAMGISANNCSSLSTYISSSSQTSFFQEVVLTDSNTSNIGKIVYSTKLENQHIGFDGQLYDFQMIVPENGLTGFSGLTPYYLYTEIQ